MEAALVAVQHHRAGPRLALGAIAPVHAGRAWALTLPHARVLVGAGVVAPAPRHLQQLRAAPPHLLLPLVLDDTKPEEREIGMACGFSWYSVADKLVVYTDFGTSSGMQQGIDVGRSQGLRIEYRRLY